MLFILQEEKMHILFYNETLWLLSMLINFLLILLAYKLWGKTGLFIFIPISTILANVQVIKQVDLFGFHGTMGDILYCGIFLVSDILSENYGKKMARNTIYIGFFSLISTTVIMLLSLKIHPNTYDTSQSSLEFIFGFLPRITVASLTAFLISQTYDVWAYQFWREKFPEFKHIWIRNNFSTLASQFIDGIIFTVIAFYGVFEVSYMVKIFITSYILKTIVAIFATPFVYAAALLKTKNKVKEI